MRTKGYVKWCCGGFRASYEGAGSRGVGLLVVRTEDDREPRFILQFRAVDIGSSFSHQGPEPLSVVSEVRLRWCPWCGRNLSKWYKKAWPDLVRPKIPVIELSDSPPEEA